MRRTVAVCASTVALVLREHLRLPAFSLPTFSMPALLYLFFGARGHGDGRTAQSLELLGYCGFAVLGVALFSFGATLARERVSPWEQLQRTLPVSPLRYTARVAVVLTFSLASLVPLLVIGLLVSDADHTVVLRGANVFPLLLGIGVFSALGTTLGYWLPVRGAVPLTNLVYVPLSYAGGLFGSTSGRQLDRWHLLPTTQWNELLYGTAVEHRTPLAPVLGLRRCRHPASQVLSTHVSSHASISACSWRRGWQVWLAAVCAGTDDMPRTARAARREPGVRERYGLLGSPLRRGSRLGRPHRRRVGG